jgi:hypothetical protein
LEINNNNNNKKLIKKFKLLDNNLNWKKKNVLFIF